MNSVVDEYKKRLNSIYNQFVTKNDDIASIFLRDDVDSLVNMLAAQKCSPRDYTNCYGQGLLHLAGIFTFCYFYFIAQYDSFNILKYLLQQDPDCVNIKEDAVIFTFHLNDQ